MLKFANSLFGRVVIALILGVVLGIFFPGFAESSRPFGDGFVNIIKMVVAPLVFCVVVSQPVGKLCRDDGDRGLGKRYRL